MMKRYLLALVLACALSAPAWAGFDEGMAAYNRGDYETAYHELLPLAEQGDATAQFNLGVRYDKGQGVPQDYAQAHMWYNLAAAQGDEQATKNRDLLAAQHMTSSQVAEAQKLARSWPPEQHAVAPAPLAPDTTLVRQRIARIQRQLASLGYDTGPADGVLGPRTRAARGRHRSPQAGNRNRGYRQAA